MFDLSPAVIQFAVILLAAISVGMIAFVVAYPFLSGEKKTEKRTAEIAAQTSKSRAARSSESQELAHRKKAVADTMLEIENRQKGKGRVTLRTRLERAGLSMTPNAFYIGSLILGVGVGITTFVMGAPAAAAAGAAFVGTLGLPRFLLNKITQRRQNKFVNEFANSIDVIVRGVKSGLPLNECLGIIARESPEPVRSEFAELVEQQRIGIPLGDCFERMMTRMPLPEVNFFAIVIAIQSKAGGNLAEALGNLSDVLRARKMMAAKVKALSAEAKASAGILGALPFAVMAMVHFTSPNYISLLFIDRTGNFLLLIAGVWMTFGVLTMKKMINFKY
ncbi:MAG: type II secretion system F family protein [Pseudomonadota bacterium]